jgi:hypothetical protein
MRSLPVDERGYVVPWFVAWVDGKPEFRVTDGRKWALAVEKKLCWVCGQALGTRFAFVVGPMCGINRISAEPPSHKDCAEFSAMGCPFLSMPKMVRREGGLPEEVTDPAGVMLRRNPGVGLLWHTREYRVFKAPNGYLIRMGEPFEVAWWTQGRQATRQEVEEAIASGLPALLEACDAEEKPEDRKAARAHLEEQRLALWPLLPAMEAVTA